MRKTDSVLSWFLSVSTSILLIVGIHLRGCCGDELSILLVVGEHQIGRIALNM